MPNINVLKRLEKISVDLSKLVNHVSKYSGFSSRDVQAVEQEATAVATLAVQLAAAAREYRGDPSSVNSILESVRADVGG